MFDKGAQSGRFEGNQQERAMIEIIIERWSNRDGTTDHLWTLWRDGSRLHLGNRHDEAQSAENEAIAFCQQTLGQQPDRVTRL